MSAPAEHVSPTRPPANKPRRGRRVLLWTSAALLALGVLLVLLLAWILASGSGRDFVLARLVAALPPGSLQYARAEGTVSGPLVLHDVRYTQPDGLLVEVRRVTVDLAPRALLSQRVVVQQLTLEDGRVVLVATPPPETPQPWPRSIALPQTLPALDLPVAISLQALDVQRLRIEQADVSLLDIRRLQAVGALDSGRLALQSLTLDSDKIGITAQGDFDSASAWASTLDAQITLPRADAQPLPLALTLRGDLDDLQLDARANLPEPATLNLRVRGGLAAPQLELAINAPRIDPAELGSTGEPIAIDLRASGTLQRIQLEGNLAQGTQTLHIAPSTIGYDDGIAQLAPLSLELLSGTVLVQGQVNLQAQAPQVGVTLDWRDIVIPADTPDAVVRSSGNARVDGPLADYAITLKGDLARGDDAANIALQGRGSEERITLESLDITMPGGGLAATGVVSWAPQVTWALDATLREFDPAWFVPEFPGAVDATLRSEGRIEDAGPAATLQVSSLGGTLRSRRLGGTLDARLEPDASGRATVDLRIGDSQITGSGTWSDSVSADLNLSPLYLADVLPDTRGRVEGHVKLSGKRDTPTIDADLVASDISMADNRIASANLRAHIEALQRGSFSVEAIGLDVAGQSIATLSLSGEGAREQHTITLALDGEPARVSLELAGGERDGRWRGLLNALTLEPTERKPWRLRAPAELAYNTADGAINVTQACLASEPASLCVSADWSGNGGEADLALEGFPLAHLDPVLAQAFGHPVSAFGVVTAQGNASRNKAGAITATLQLDTANAGIRLDPESDRELLELSALALRANLDPQRLVVTLDSGIAKTGRIAAQIDTATPLEADGALSGTVEIALPDLTVIELFTNQFVAPTGTLQANLRLAGSRSAPLLEGRATLAQFGGELPALGLVLSEGNLVFASAGTYAGTLQGSIKSGDGTLRIDGRVDTAEGAAELARVTLKGENLTAVSIPEAQATASPDINIVVADGTMKVRGSVAVPYARIDLEQLQGTTSASSDVVVVDAETTQGSGLAVDSDVTVTLGDDVRLNGFGLKSKLEGTLAVRDRPGRATLGRGAIQVSGGYKAYGQDLTITRGALSFASTPIDNPALNIRAEREIDDVTVGVQVRGTALSPELTLWSEPAMEQAEQLSYLVLGRPLRSASQEDGAQLSQAAAAFGGNFLAKRLGARMGLDEVGVEDNRALGGAALTVGKFLSPRLYVSYGVALFGSGQVVTFKYILSRLWSVQIDSGTENRAALNYKLER